jgi:hypothetical protein
LSGLVRKFRERAVVAEQWRRNAHRVVLES